MAHRTWMKCLLAVVPALFIATGGAGAQTPPDGCLARLPGDRVTLNLREANVQTTLRLLAQQYRVNMIVTEDVKGTVTLDFFKVPARQVFQAIVDAANLRCVVMGELLRVSGAARVKAEEDAEARKAKAEADARRAEAKAEADTRLAQAKAALDAARQAELAARGPVREEIIRLRYADAGEVARTLAGILGIRSISGAFTAPVPLQQLSAQYAPAPPVNIPSSPPPPVTLPAPEQGPAPETVAEGLTVGFYRKTNSVFVRYYARELERIVKIVREYLDVPTPQIQIAAQMVITTLHNLEQIGVQWGGAGSVNVGGTKMFVGQGFAQASETPAGQGNIQPNPGGTQVPPVNPPLVGNIVNLPTSLLPTLLGATPAGGLLLGLVGQNFNINLAIQALEVQGKARTLAAPKTVTLENATAFIERGFEVPYTSTGIYGTQTQFKDALLRLEVTPRLIRGDDETKISMKVVFNNDVPDFSQSVLGNPPIFKRHQSTEVVVREGQRLVIGGVTNDQSGNTVRQVPVLSRIPVLGYLFRSREVSGDGEELIVIITPSVVAEAGPPPKR
jgi:type IV pilus assembly protein PilQ